MCIRDSIDYCHAEALTKVGLLGIKVWMCRGEVYGKKELAPNFTQSKESGRGSNSGNNDWMDTVEVAPKQNKDWQGIIKLFAKSGAAVRLSRRTSVEPVSYTHLDVYKRQGHHLGVGIFYAGGRHARRSDLCHCL